MLKFLFMNYNNLMSAKNCANIKIKQLNNHNKYKNVLIVVLRCCVVILVFLLACCVCYLTIIVPDPSDVDCNRKCHSAEWPMICRYKFIIESQIGHDNTQIFTINGMSPGPAITVCHNDIIVIDVENRIPEISITIHWHGQRQNETPFMDGVPMITQCPILSFTTFQYKFRATQIGTHFYYAYSGKLRNHGAIGKFIVHTPNDTVRNLYDVEVAGHSVLVTELDNRIFADVATFLVVPTKRYRFRIIFGSAANGHRIKFKITNHTLKIVAIDGHSIQPVEHNEIYLNLGDRVDFVLCADQIDKNEFAVEIISTQKNQSWNGLLMYERQTNSIEPSSHILIDNGTYFDERFVTVNRTIYIPIVHHITNLMRPPTDNQSAAHMGTDVFLGIGNLTFTFPSKPYYLLTNVNPNEMRHQWPNECSDGFDGGARNDDRHCENIDFRNVCGCVLVQRLEMGEYVEIIFVNFDERASYTYHLHGYSFFIVGVSKILSNTATLEQIRDQNKNHKLLNRNFDHPPQKDTVTIESKTIVAIRFVANNPGYWMLRDFNSDSWTRGIDVVLQVGDTARIKQPPSTFPKCGDWIGPKYFFI